MSVTLLGIRSSHKRNLSCSLEFNRSEEALPLPQRPRSESCSSRQRGCTKQRRLCEPVERKCRNSEVECGYSCASEDRKLSSVNCGASLQNCIIDDLEITDEVVGIGSYGEVRKARFGGSVVAAKRPHQIFQENGHLHPSVRERFLDECMKQTDIRHPNLVQFLGIHFDQQANDSPVLVTELMKCSLTSLLSSPQSISMIKKLKLAQDISQGLHYLHSRGLVHRDLSSNNILLTEEYRAKIADLGVARACQPDGFMSTCTVCPGSIVYMPPEALSSEPDCNKTIDIFSFGVLLVQIVTRNFPCPTDSFMEVKVSQNGNPLHERIPEVKRRKSDLDQMKTILEEENGPLCLHDLALKCLQNSPQNRPQSVLVICNALKKMILQAEQSSTEQPYPLHVPTSQQASCSPSQCSQAPVSCCGDQSSADSTNDSNCHPIEEGRGSSALVVAGSVSCMVNTQDNLPIIVKLGLEHMQETANAPKVSSISQESMDSYSTPHGTDQGPATETCTDEGLGPEYTQKTANVPKVSSTSQESMDSNSTPQEPATETTCTDEGHRGVVVCNNGKVLKLTTTSTSEDYKIQSADISEQVNPELPDHYFLNSDSAETQLSSQEYIQSSEIHISPPIPEADDDRIQTDVSSTCNKEEEVLRAQLSTAQQTFREQGTVCNDLTIAEEHNSEEKSDHNPGSDNMLCQHKNKNTLSDSSYTGMGYAAVGPSCKEDETPKPKTSSERLPKEVVRVPSNETEEIFTNNVPLTPFSHVHASGLSDEKLTTKANICMSLQLYFTDKNDRNSIEHWEVEGNETKIMTKQPAMELLNHTHILSPSVPVKLIKALITQNKPQCRGEIWIIWKDNGLELLVQIRVTLIIIDNNSISILKFYSVLKCSFLNSTQNVLQHCNTSGDMILQCSSTLASIQYQTCEKQMHRNNHCHLENVVDGDTISSPTNVMDPSIIECFLNAARRLPHFQRWSPFFNQQKSTALLGLAKQISPTAVNCKSSLPDSLEHCVPSNTRKTLTSLPQPHVASDYLTLAAEKKFTTQKSDVLRPPASRQLTTNHFRSLLSCNTTYGAIQLAMLIIWRSKHNAQYSVIPCSKNLVSELDISYKVIQQYSDLEVSTLPSTSSPVVQWYSNQSDQRHLASLQKYFSNSTISIHPSIRCVVNAIRFLQCLFSRKKSLKKVILLWPIEQAPSITTESKLPNEHHTPNCRSTIIFRNIAVNNSTEERNCISSPLFIDEYCRPPQTQDVAHTCLHLPYYLQLLEVYHSSELNTTHLLEPDALSNECNSEVFQFDQSLARLEVFTGFCLTYCAGYTMARHGAHTQLVILIAKLWKLNGLDLCIFQGSIIAFPRSITASFVIPKRNTLYRSTPTPMHYNDVRNTVLPYSSLPTTPLRYEGRCFLDPEIQCNSELQLAPFPCYTITESPNVLDLIHAVNALIDTPWFQAISSFLQPWITTAIKRSQPNVHHTYHRVIPLATTVKVVMVNECSTTTTKQKSSLPKFKEWLTPISRSAIVSSIIRATILAPAENDSVQSPEHNLLTTQVITIHPDADIMTSPVCNLAEKNASFLATTYKHLILQVAMWLTGKANDGYVVGTISKMPFSAAMYDIINLSAAMYDIINHVQPVDQLNTCQILELLWVFNTDLKTFREQSLLFQPQDTRQQWQPQNIITNIMDPSIIECFLNAATSLPHFQRWSPFFNQQKSTALLGLAKQISPTAVNCKSSLPDSLEHCIPSNTRKMLTSLPQPHVASDYLTLAVERKLTTQNSDVLQPPATQQFTTKQVITIQPNADIMTSPVGNLAEKNASFLATARKHLISQVAMLLTGKANDGYVVGTISKMPFSAAMYNFINHLQPFISVDQLCSCQILELLWVFNTDLKTFHEQSLLFQPQDTRQQWQPQNIITNKFVIPAYLQIWWYLSIRFLILAILRFPFEYMINLCTEWLLLHSARTYSRTVFYEAFTPSPTESPSRARPPILPKTRDHNFDARRKIVNKYTNSEHPDCTTQSRESLLIDQWDERFHGIGSAKSPSNASSDTSPSQDSYQSSSTLRDRYVDTDRTVMLKPEENFMNIKESVSQTVRPAMCLKPNLNIEYSVLTDTPSDALRSSLGVLRDQSNPDDPLRLSRRRNSMPYSVKLRERATLAFTSMANPEPILVSRKASTTNLDEVPAQSKPRHTRFSIANSDGMKNQSPPEVNAEGIVYKCTMDESFKVNTGCDDTNVLLDDEQLAIELGSTASSVSSGNLTIISEDTITGRNSFIVHQPEKSYHQPEEPFVAIRARDSHFNRPGGMFPVLLLLKGRLVTPGGSLATHSTEVDFSIVLPQNFTSASQVELAVGCRSFSVHVKFTEEHCCDVLPNTHTCCQDGGQGSSASSTYKSSCTENAQQTSGSNSVSHSGHSRGSNSGGGGGDSDDSSGDGSSSEGSASGGDGSGDDSSGDRSSSGGSAANGDGDGDDSGDDGSSSGGSAANGDGDGDDSGDDGSSSGGSAANGDGDGDDSGDDGSSSGGSAANGDGDGDDSGDGSGKDDSDGSDSDSDSGEEGAKFREKSWTAESGLTESPPNGNTADTKKEAGSTVAIVKPNVSSIAARSTRDDPIHEVQHSIMPQDSGTQETKPSSAGPLPDSNPVYKIPYPQPTTECDSSQTNHGNMKTDRESAHEFESRNEMVKVKEVLKDDVNAKVDDSDDCSDDKHLSLGTTSESEELSNHVSEDTTTLQDSSDSHIPQFPHHQTSSQEPNDAQQQEVSSAYDDSVSPQNTKSDSIAAPSNISYRQSDVKQPTQPFFSTSGDKTHGSETDISASPTILTQQEEGHYGMISSEPTVGPTSSLKPTNQEDFESLSDWSEQPPQFSSSCGETNHQPAANVAVDEISDEFGQLYNTPAAESNHNETADVRPTVGSIPMKFDWSDESDTDSNSEASCTLPLTRPNLDMEIIRFRVSFQSPCRNDTHISLCGEPSM